MSSTTGTARIDPTRIDTAATRIVFSRRFGIVLAGLMLVAGFGLSVAEDASAHPTAAAADVRPGAR